MILVEQKGTKDLWIFSRENKKLVVNKIIDFHPYFYFKDPNGEYVSITGEKYSKYVVPNNGGPGRVKVERDKYEDVCEADIPYENRFIIDRFDIIPKSDVRKCYIDIEIKRTLDGYESPDKANNPILAICCYDSFDKQYTQFCINTTHKTEIELLKDFIKYIKEKDPDMLIAWNGDGFDFPFLINRITKLKLDSNELARQLPNFHGLCHRLKNNYKIYQMQGRVLFDLMYAYKKIMSGEGRESWSLDYISRYENLGGKEEYRGELDDLYINDINKFCAYNKRDVELLVLIDEKLKIVDFFDEIRRMCYCQFIDVFMNSKMADCLCLKYAKNNNIILPSMKKNTRESYKGGFVHDSEPKLHKNIAVMDMKSLYPSIMIGFNTSYETILPQHTSNCINLDNKYFFKKDKGIIPSIVKPLLDKREQIKQEMINMDKNSRDYNTLWMNQYALKVIANSFYGVMGFPLFRLYNKTVAESITYGARMITNEVIRWFEEKGFKVVYGDTDSVFIEMKDCSSEQFKKLNDDINNYFKIYFMKFGVEEKNNIFKLEFEKIFKTVFFKRKSDGTGAKKKYAGRVIWEDGFNTNKMSIKGFESRRSDNSACGRKFLKEVLRMICYEIPQPDIRKFVEQFKTDIRTAISPEDLGLPIGITKPLKEYGNQIHARAARYSNIHHQCQIKSGDKIKYLYIKHPQTNVIAFKSDKWLWDGYHIDYDKMTRRIIDMKVGPIFNSLGWSYKWLEIMKKKKKKEVRFEDTLKQGELW